jgi:PmbA protein
MQDDISLAQYAVSLGKAKGADDVVAQVARSHEKQIKFSNSDITLSKEWLHSQMSLFVAKDKKLVSTTIEHPSKKTIACSIKKAVGLTSLMAPKEDYQGIGGGGSYLSHIYNGDMITQDDFLFSLTKEVINTALEYAPEIAGVIYVGKEESGIATSEGLTETDRNSWVTLSLRALNDGASGHGVHCARTLKDFFPLQAAHKAGDIAQRSVSPCSIKQGRYTVVFDPLAFANLVSHYIDFSSIFSIESGTSFLIDKLGETVASEMVTLSDDGTHPQGIHSQKFDDEGVAIRKTDIIKNGVLMHYLHNTSTARKYGTETTGNAGLVAPHAWNAVFDPGDRSYEELFLENAGALYITNVWYTRFQNYRTGDFSTIPRDGAFLIKKGGDLQPIGNIRISDNLFLLFSRIDGLSRQQEQIYWWEASIPSFVPYVVMKDVNITKPMGK